ncbi:MAG: SMP-30/gluconolactonase/LRE family protein [Gemmatimonadaceae bacterium]
MNSRSARAIATALLVAGCSNSSKLQDTTAHGTAGANSDTVTTAGAGNAAGAQAGTGGSAGNTGNAGNTATAGGATKVKTISGFQTPESVKWDSASGYWFVSNINGQPPAKDGNGFISRLTKDGTVDSLHFITSGKNGVTLNGPKGIAIIGDTLFVADIDVIRAFNKTTGAPIRSWDVSKQGAKFLNDVATTPNGDVYVTDTQIAFGANGSVSHTGTDRIFTISRDRKSAAIGIQSDSLGRPNGITWDARNNRFIVVAFGTNAVHGWAPNGKAVTTIATGPGQFDGVEIARDGRILVSSWADSAVSVINGSTMSHIVTGVEAPADIGLDPARGLLAVPLFNKGQVELWQLK